MTLEIGHYTAHAVPSLLKCADRAERNVKDGGYVATRIRSLAALIRGSQKFFLPDGGTLFDSSYSALPDVLHLPFKDIVIEHADHELGAYGRRIIYAHEEDGLIQITPIMEAHGEWTPFYASANLIRAAGNDGRPGFEWGWWNSPAIIKDLNNVAESVGNNIHDCGRVVLSLIEVLQCANVTTEIVAPSAPLNRKRVRNGKEPFDSYHVLKIPDSNKTSGHKGGSHASPRQHLRRGHIRRIGNDKTTWVNATIVGSAKNGTVTKDYLITPT